MIKVIKLSVVSAMIVGGVAIGGHGAVQAAGDHEELIRSRVLPEVRSLASDPRVVAAVRMQNQQNAGLGQADIDRLDKQWRAETAAGNRPLIDKVLANELSQFLGEFKNERRGMYTEIFVMDGKGLNAGQSDVTSDYWQGDEDKWQKTYNAGAGSVLIDEVEFDESTQTFQSQVSLPVVDSGSGEVVGAVTVGVNVDLLQ